MHRGLHCLGEPRHAGVLGQCIPLAHRWWFVAYPGHTQVALCLQAPGCDRNPKQQHEIVSSLFVHVCKHTYAYIYIYVHIYVCMYLCCFMLYASSYMYMHSHTFDARGRHLGSSKWRPRTPPFSCLGFAMQVGEERSRDARGRGYDKLPDAVDRTSGFDGKSLLDLEFAFSIADPSMDGCPTLDAQQDLSSLWLCAAGHCWAQLSLLVGLCTKRAGRQEHPYAHEGVL
jgi:hypothetical protein